MSKDLPLTPEVYIVTEHGEYCNTPSSMIVNIGGHAYEVHEEKPLFDPKQVLYPYEILQCSWEEDGEQKSGWGICITQLFE